MKVCDLISQAKELRELIDKKLDDYIYGDHNLDSEEQLEKELKELNKKYKTLINREVIFK